MQSQPITSYVELNRRLQTYYTRGLFICSSRQQKENKKFRLCDRRRPEMFLQHERDGSPQSRIAGRVCGDNARGGVSEGAAFDNIIYDRADPVPGAGYLSDHNDDIGG